MEHQYLEFNIGRDRWAIWSGFVCQRQLWQGKQLGVLWWGKQLGGPEREGCTRGPLSYGGILYNKIDHFISSIFLW